MPNKKSKIQPIFKQNYQKLLFFKVFYKNNLELSNEEENIKPSESYQ